MKNSSGRLGAAFPCKSVAGRFSTEGADVKPGHQELGPWTFQLMHSSLSSGLRSCRYFLRSQKGEPSVNEEPCLSSCWWTARPGRQQSMQYKIATWRPVSLPRKDCLALPDEEGPARELEGPERPASVAFNSSSSALRCSMVASEVLRLTASPNW